MRPADSALGIFRSPDPDLCVPENPARGMNPGVYSLGISEDLPRYLSSKFDASVRSDC